MSQPVPILMPRLVDRRARPSFVVAVNQLIKLGVAPESVFIRLVGPYEDYDGQVRAQEPEPGTPLSDETDIVLDVGITGIVDHMPYQFFTTTKHSSSVASSWESRARGIMAPIDGTAAKMSAMMSFEQMRFDEAIVEVGHLNRVVDLYGSEPRRCCTHDEQLGLWSALMRSFNEWSGNPYGIAWVLSILLDCRIRVRENIPAEHPIDPTLQSRLRNAFCRLGDDWILGDRFADCDSRYELVLYEIGQAHPEDWLPNGSRRRLLDKIMAMCNPVHLQWSLRFDLPAARRPIGRKERSVYLGASWHLGNGPSIRHDDHPGRESAVANG
ncbi:hypothetical protein GF356_10225 [candidate division GN15 bacterium]|nr:hypothetical protein [candidate division GN15 bacterium]